MLERWNDGMAPFGQINAYGGIKLSIVNCQLLMKSAPTAYYRIKITNQQPKAVMVCIDSFKLRTMTAFNQKLLRGDWISESVGQWVSGSVGQLGGGEAPGMNPFIMEDVQSVNR
jgi:hypothetical protein